MVPAPKSYGFAYTSSYITRCACPPDASVAMKQKYKHLEMELRGSDDTLLSMLEYGADPKEMEHPGADCLLLYPAARHPLRAACDSHRKNVDRRLLNQPNEVVQELAKEDNSPVFH